MEPFELTNTQRMYFGLDPIDPSWVRFALPGDQYRPSSILYFEGETIKRQITSTAEEYSEKHLNELTRDRALLLPKTNRGKDQRLTAAVLERRTPQGVYIHVSFARGIRIGNFRSETTFYSSSWDSHEEISRSPRDQINEFIATSPDNHLSEIQKFKAAKRQNIKFRSGDYFRFKSNRTEYGFGRVLLDIHKVRKQVPLSPEHGLNYIMMRPVLVQVFVYRSITGNVDIDFLDRQPRLPTSYMADNLLLYGEYEIIGHRDLDESEFEYPISYGKTIDRRPVVFLQWGLIHLELPISRFSNHVEAKDQLSTNPYGAYSIGFTPTYGAPEVHQTIKNGGAFDFEKCFHYASKYDLRNPTNDAVRREIFCAFGLDPDSSYEENSIATNTPRTADIIRKL